MSINWPAQFRAVVVPRWVYGGDMRLYMALLWAAPVFANINYKISSWTAEFVVWRRHWAYATASSTMRHGGPRHAAKTPLLQQLGLTFRKSPEPVDGQLQLA